MPNFSMLRDAAADDDGDSGGGGNDGANADMVMVIWW